LAETPNFNQIAFSADDAWIVVQSQLSSGSYFSFFRKQADGKYAEDAPAEKFFENGQMEKTATVGQVDRWSVNFEQWAHGFERYAFIFSWSARLSRRGPDSYFMRYSGCRGVYDLQSRTVVKTLERGKMTTAGQDAEARLNDIYRGLRSLLDEPGKESLRVEELVWLKKRDEIENPREKTDFTNARCDELGDRIQKLRK
jgi:hypothetical protein